MNQQDPSAQKTLLVFIPVLVFLCWAIYAINQAQYNPPEAWFDFIPSHTGTYDPLKISFSVLMLFFIAYHWFVIYLCGLGMIIHPVCYIALLQGLSTFLMLRICGRAPYDWVLITSVALYTPALLFWLFSSVSLILISIKELLTDWTFTK